MVTGIQSQGTNRCVERDEGRLDFVKWFGGPLLGWGVVDLIS